MICDPGDEKDESAADIPAPAVTISCLARRGERLVPSVRAAAEETAVAFSFNGSTHAVMMATPADLGDFAVGFALTEGLIETPADVLSLEVIAARLGSGAGVELRMWLPEGRAKAYQARRRTMAGPTGCGLCGIESLEEALRPAPALAPNAGGGFDSSAIPAAMAALAGAQALNARTRAVHAAGFFTPEAGLVAVREDVGRHNALDKLAGALARGGWRAADGIVALTSRVSIELIQKAARLNAPVVAAISAPTAAAVRLAEACGITLVAVARGDEFEIFTHPHRIIERTRNHDA
ncbi:formate dehydrogenase accessory sulfurtransferase FdhD [Methylocapsa palsarum]|uniref:Sulfur carrier protein FdhD n=1 Tax=Methylocapsa palsarum TaxID=1612308 RepID=A0A1I3WBV1_9HYPH|nr:formate dehydrogenase accessory sulfurtransferase FdhD [Methylocapsa palsarum]SFK03951.1 FdhD protein [Methylocapsa palsarum]